MKKIIYLVTALLSIIGCKEKTPDNGDTPTPPVPEVTLAEKIEGQWHCVVSDIDADLWLSICADSSFELYQQIGEGAHRLYRGTWVLDEKQAELSGKYNDGTSWGSSYAVTISEDGNSMTLSPENDSAKEDHIYRKEDIPAEVTENCVVIVKSETDIEPAL